MYFTKSLLAVLASTALTTFVTSSPIDSNAVAARNDGDAGLVRRLPNFDDQVKGSPAAWQALVSYCSSTSNKRDLEARGSAPPGPFTEVAMGDSQGMTFPIGLWTQNLKSCIGFGVTADQGRVLGHFTSDESSKQAQWDKFAGFVKSDWTNVKGFMSKPDRDTNKNPIMNDEALDLMDKVADHLKDRLDSIVKGGVAVVERSMELGTDQYDNTMSIDGQNNVAINGQAVSPK